MTAFKMNTLLYGLLATGLASTIPQKRAEWYPTVSSIEEWGVVDEQGLNRDSCGSVRVGDRVLWTCRDTQPVGSNGVPTLPIWSSSAAWTGFNIFTTPDPKMYSPKKMVPFYPYSGDQCGGNTAGGCSDGTRYALWPDSPPIITSNLGNYFVGYTWVRNSHIKGLGPVGSSNPSTTLYKFVFDNTDHNAIPSPSIINENWWGTDTISFGAYGSVVKDGIAYLFGQPSNRNVCLAKVPTDKIEDRSQYQYYVNGAWTKSVPSLANSGSCNIPNASAGGQGTYYFSYHWNKWVWIGQAGISISSYFMITTADKIEGPWATPKFFYQGHDGSSGLPAYTLQAHPGLDATGVADQNAIFISYTKADTDRYSTPLVRIHWN